jgi:TetR/AcrR family transcriptional regulator
MVCSSLPAGIAPPGHETESATVIGHLSNYFVEFIDHMANKLAMATRKPAPRIPQRRGPRRSAGRPPASKPALESRQQILDAALQAFGESGYEEMSVRRLAARLGVSHNLISHYFQSKEELWRACVDWSVGSVTREVLALAAELPPEADVLDKLRATMELFIHLAARFPANLFIITNEGAAGGSRLDYVFDQMMAPALESWNALMNQAWREGKIRKVDARTTFFLLTHGGACMFSMVPLAERIGGKHPLDEKFIAEQARTVADIILHGIVADTAPRKRTPRRKPAR